MGNAGNGLAAARGRKAVVFRASPLWLVVVLLIVLLGVVRCAGGDEAATPPPSAIETQDDVDRTVTAATTPADDRGGPTPEGYVAATSGSGILVADGNFEDGARGWYLAAYDGAAGALRRTRAESKLGNASLALSVTTPGDVGAGVRGQLVPPATPHTLVAWVKSPPGTLNALRVIGSSGDRLVSPRVAGNGTWQQLVGRFRTDRRETSLEIRVMQGGEAATSYIDAVELQFQHGHAAVSSETLLRRLDGARIAVDGRIVTLDAATLACGGEGRGRTRAGEQRWAHFTCIQPTFPPGEIVGRDALFRVHVTSPATVAVTDTRMVR
jgi:hypothetical protein